MSVKKFNFHYQSTSPEPSELLRLKSESIDRFERSWPSLPQQEYRLSKRLAFLGLFLCARSDKSDDLAFRDEALTQHVPTHAAASFLKTATPLSMSQDQNKTSSFKFSTTRSNKLYIYLDEQTVYKLQTGIPSPINQNGQPKAATSPMMTLHRPLSPQTPSFDFDTPYPCPPRRVKNMEGSALKSVHTKLKDSLVLNKSRLGNHTVVWSDVS